MKRLILSTLFLALAGMSGSAVLAKGGPGGGNAGGHFAANSNGIHSVDRDKGLDRAADRRNSRSIAKRHTRKRIRPAR